MAAESGRKSFALIERLFREAPLFDFFQAVRLLERAARERAEREPALDRQPVGRDGAPGREFVRFRALVSMSFPAGSISQIRRPQPQQAVPEADWPPPEMSEAFLGLIGPNGVLPPHYTRLVLRRIREKDHAVREFLDLFHHRLVSLFYRAWEKYRLPFAYERFRLDPTGEEIDWPTRALYCLVGRGTEHLLNCLEIDDEAFLFYSGHFARGPRSALTLECILADYFELRVGVHQYQGQWLYLEADDRSLLPGGTASEGRNCQIGVNLVVGEKVWDVQSKFRVRIGPLTYDQFRRFMPSGDALRPLCQMVRSFVGPELDFDVQPVLWPREVPWCQLGATGPDRARLGWNTWVRAQEFEREVDNAVFSLDDA